MNYLSNTTAYLFRYGRGRRFLTIFLLSLIPSVALSYSYPFSDYIGFIISLYKADFRDFGSLWLASFHHDAYSLIGLAVSFVLFVLFTAYITTLITRSIRVGEFRLTKLLPSINENFFPAIATVGFIVISAFIFHTLFTLLAFLFLQIPSRAFGLTLIAVFFIGLCLLAVYIWSALTLWLPTMSFSGQYVTKAFVVSFYKSRSYQRLFFVPALIIFAFLLVTSIGAHFIGSVWYAKWIINAVSLSVVYTFSVTFTEISYCETESITREDMVRRYFGR